MITKVKKIVENSNNKVKRNFKRFVNENHKVLNSTNSKAINEKLSTFLANNSILHDNFEVVEKQSLVVRGANIPMSILAVKQTNKKVFEQLNSILACNKQQRNIILADKNPIRFINEKYSILMHKYGHLTRKINENSDLDLMIGTFNISSIDELKDEFYDDFVKAFSDDFNNVALNDLFHNEGELDLTISKDTNTLSGYTASVILSSPDVNAIDKQLEQKWNKIAKQFFETEIIEGVAESVNEALQFEDSEIYKKAKELMNPEYIDHHASDLYLKVNDISKKLVDEYEYKSVVTTFKSETDGGMWFEIPFAYNEHPVNEAEKTISVEKLMDMADRAGEYCIDAKEALKELGSAYGSAQIPLDAIEERLYEYDMELSDVTDEVFEDANTFKIGNSVITPDGIGKIKSFRKDVEHWIVELENGYENPYSESDLKLNGAVNEDDGSPEYIAKVQVEYDKLVKKYNNGEDVLSELNKAEEFLGLPKTGEKPVNENDGDIYAKAKELMNTEDIDHHASDLYLKVNDISADLVDKYEFKNNVTTFKSETDGGQWFEIPFAWYKDSVNEDENSSESIRKQWNNKINHWLENQSTELLIDDMPDDIYKEFMEMLDKLPNKVNENDGDPEIISKLRDIVSNQQYQDLKDTVTGNTVRVDMGTASLIIQIYDNINDAQKADFVSKGLIGMKDLAWKISKKFENEEMVGNSDLINESYDVMNESVSSDIKKTKQKLIDSAKSGKFGENFGQNEVQKLKDKYKYNDLVYGTPEQRSDAKLIDNFDEWCMNYTPINESQDEIDEFIDAVDKGDSEALKELVKNGKISKEEAFSWYADDKDALNWIKEQKIFEDADSYVDGIEYSKEKIKNWDGEGVLKFKLSKPVDNEDAKTFLFSLDGYVSDLFKRPFQIELDANGISVMVTDLDNIGEDGKPINEDLYDNTITYKGEEIMVSKDSNNKTVYHALGVSDESFPSLKKVKEAISSKSVNESLSTIDIELFENIYNEIDDVDLKDDEEIIDIIWKKMGDKYDRSDIEEMFYSSAINEDGQIATLNEKLKKLGESIFESLSDELEQATNLADLKRNDPPLFKEAKFMLDVIEAISNKNVEAIKTAISDKFGEYKDEYAKTTRNRLVNQRYNYSAKDLISLLGAGVFENNGSSLIDDELSSAKKWSDEHPELPERGDTWYLIKELVSNPSAENIGDTLESLNPRAWREAKDEFIQEMYNMLMKSGNSSSAGLFKSLFPESVNESDIKFNTINESVFDHENFAKNNEWIGAWNDTYLSNKLGIDVNEITERDKDLIMLYQLKNAGRKREDITAPDLQDLADEVFGGVVNESGEDFIKEYTSRDDQFKYMLLSRMKSDCEYFLGNGGRADKHLFMGNVPDQIKLMNALWDSFTEKPEWLSKEQIAEYAKQMNVSVNEDGNVDDDIDNFYKVVGIISKQGYDIPQELYDEHLTPDVVKTFINGYDKMMDESDMDDFIENQETFVKDQLNTILPDNIKRAYVTK